MDYEYDRRSGDREFVEKCRYRMTRFVEGMLALRGESGLLEHIPVQFVDWSISNAPFNLEPISLANNCLAVDALEKLAELYRVDEWKTAAAEMREVLERAAPGYFSKGDAASYADGKLVRQGCATESAAALEIWSGFHRGDKAFLRNFVKAMGPCPQYRPDPNIGRSNLFIGLMIRFDALSKLNQPEVLLNELREVYLPELRDGSGTLFENYHELSGCHGFNAAAGALLMSDILGLGQPHQKDQTILLKPAPCGLLWASGAEQCADGPIFMKWHADYEEHLLDMTVSVPKGWRYDVQLPFGLNGWTVKINQTIYQKGVE